MSITINGTSGISGVDGSAGTPALQGSDTNTGISFGADTVNINTGGTTRATVDSSGRVLVGTSSALTGSNSQYSKLVSLGNSLNTGGSYVAFGLGQVGTSLGAGVDVATINFTDNAAGQFASIACFTDAACGAGDYPGRLVFSTTADGASSPTERMRITSTGALCVGTTSNIGTTRFAVESDATTVNPMAVSNTRTGAGNDYAILFYRANTIVGSIQTSLSATSYTTSSDYRLKDNIAPVTDGITRLQQLKPSRFNFIADPNTVVDGFLAHEVQDVVPEAITGEKDAEDADGNPIYQGIDQSKLVPLLTAALQEAIAKIESLETRLTALEGGAAQ